MKISICYSPTGGSKKAVRFASNFEGTFYDWTLPKARTEKPKFKSEDYLFFSFPVYSGRVPKLLLHHIGELQGCGAKAIIIATYGNRHYDDAIIEMADVLSARGFRVIGAAAIVAEHSYTEKVATDYPIAADLEKLAHYCEKRIELNEVLIGIPGSRPYRPYQINKTVGKSIPMKPPKTSDDCILCGRCVKNCSVGAIAEDCVTISSSCTMCCACIKICPLEAKSLADERAIGGKMWLEENCSAQIKSIDLFN